MTVLVPSMLLAAAMAVPSSVTANRKPLVVARQGRPRENLDHHDYGQTKTLVMPHACMREPSRDPTFRHERPATKGVPVIRVQYHPMSWRLQREGYFTHTNELRALRRLSRRLGRQAPDPRTPLESLPGIVSDFEATGIESGYWRGGRFYAGWDEVLQISHAQYLGTKQQGAVSDQLVNPSGTIRTAFVNYPQRVLHAAPRIEQVAHELLRSAEGRVWIALHIGGFDWALLTSNYARLGVQFPAANGLALDPGLLHLGLGGQERRLHDIADAHGVSGSRCRHEVHMSHDEAAMLGEVWAKMIPQLKQAGIKTLGDAFDLQDRVLEQLAAPSAK